MFLLYKKNRLTGRKIDTINFASYNYLGFAQAEGPCADAVEETVREYGVSSGGTRAESGSLDLHKEAERKVARFVGKEDACIVSMGFATNSTTIPALVNKVNIITPRSSPYSFFFFSFYE